MSQARPEGVVAVPDLLDALVAAVVLVDGDGRITGWNASAEALYGYGRSEVLGARLVDVLFDEDDRGAASELFAHLRAGVPWEGDFRVRRRDGALLVSSFHLKLVDDSGAAAWIGTDRIDQGLAEQERSVLLTAERAARATAEEALGLVEAILTSAPVGIAVFDLHLQHVRVNDAYIAISGVGGMSGGAAGAPGAAGADRMLEQADVAADLRRVVTTGRTILGRHVRLDEGDGDGGPGAGGVRHFTASYFPVRTTTGTLVGAGLTVVEITEAKRAEAERAALFQRAEAARHRLAILATASTVLTSTMELEELLARLTRVLTPTAGDWCVIELLGPSGQVDHVAVSHQTKAAADDLAAFLRRAPVALDGPGPVAEVLRTGQARLVPPEETGELLVRAATDRGHPELAAQFTLGSSVVVPIEARGQVLGVLILSTEGERVLDDDDLDLAVEIAHRAALAVTNARAFQHEHQIAATLQQALLPATTRRVQGFDLAVRYVAATDGASVGGDWYDVLPFEEGVTGIVVGDVEGHDIAATTSMGQLSSALRAYAYEEYTDPAATLTHVDRLYDSLGLTYATCIFGVVDARSSTFRWSNAGHPPPLLLRQGTATFLTEGSGVLLGVTGGEGAREAAIDLQKDDLLVLYTDGLIERRGDSLQAGLGRLASVAESVGVVDAELMCDALLEALVPATAARGDDVAILVARVRPDADADADAPGVHRLPFEIKKESPALTRGFTAGVLRGAGWDSDVDTAVLLVSELVTNAVRHATGPCALTVAFEDGAVEISVEDGDARLPELRHAAAWDEHGRGLMLIGALADEWGVRPLPHGKATWFRLRSRRP